MKVQHDRVEKLLDMFRVAPGKTVSLKKDFDPGYKIPGLDKDEAKEMLEDGVKLLAELQDKLYAQNTHAVLVVFQAMDAAGKDGAIKHVMSGLNPQGCDVRSFKAPSAEELDHDYLWRCVKVLPERGRIGIFNRSYYEEVLITRVHPEILERQQLPAALKKDPKKLILHRYEEINNLENYLVNNGFAVVKFFLHVSREEQKKRFLERIDRPDKNWKFSFADVSERQHWDAYMEAYEACLSHTSTTRAPWFVIPADHKPTTRVGVAAVLHETLRGLDLHYPEISPEQKKQLALARKELERS